jgi:hypothetical protein
MWKFQLSLPILYVKKDQEEVIGFGYCYNKISVGAKAKGEPCSSSSMPA